MVTSLTALRIYVKRVYPNCSAHKLADKLIVTTTLPIRADDIRIYSVTPFPNVPNAYVFTIPLQRTIFPSTWRNFAYALQDAGIQYHTSRMLVNPEEDTEAGAVFQASRLPSPLAYYRVYTLTSDTLPMAFSASHFVRCHDSTYTVYILDSHQEGKGRVSARRIAVILGLAEELVRVWEEEMGGEKFSKKMEELVRVVRNNQ